MSEKKQKFKYAHGFAVMRAQPFHIGHKRVVDKMLGECAQVTIVLGSVQEQGTNRNPFDFQTRKKMIDNVYRQCPQSNRLHITGIKDINNAVEWPGYVIGAIKDASPDQPAPTVYYAGSEHDASWFKGSIADIVIVDRTDESFAFVSGSMLRDMIKFGDIRWKDYIPAENHALIEKHYAG